MGLNKIICLAIGDLTKHKDHSSMIIQNT